MQFQQARTVMANHLRSDDALLSAYRDNVAMLLHDRYARADWSDPTTRNRAAGDILALIFES